MLIETPANPTLVMTDIAAAAAAARAHPDRPVVAVDNTFMGPTFQHPLELGADLSLYSATKYLGGFSDMLGGVAIGRDPELVARLRGTRAILGNILQPDEAWMLDGRLPTVGLRMNRQSKNAQRIAEALQGHPRLAADRSTPRSSPTRSRCASATRSAAIPAASSPSSSRAASGPPSSSCAACASPRTR